MNYTPRRCKILHQSDCDPNKGLKPYFVTLWITSFCKQGWRIGIYNEINVGRIDLKRSPIHYNKEASNKQFKPLKP